MPGVSAEPLAHRVRFAHLGRGFHRRRRSLGYCWGRTCRPPARYPGACPSGWARRGCGWPFGGCLARLSAGRCFPYPACRPPCRRRSTRRTTGQLPGLLGQAVEPFEKAVHVRARAGTPDLRLGLLDRGLDGLVGIPDSALDLLAQVSWDSALCLFQSPPADGYRSSDKTRAARCTLSFRHA